MKEYCLVCGHRPPRHPVPRNLASGDAYPANVVSVFRNSVDDELNER
jgi:hypothetical protein